MAADDSVVLTVTIVNTGNSQLRNVFPVTTLTTSSSGTPGTLSVYSCSLDGAAAADLVSPGVTVSKPGTSVCTASYSFGPIGKIEAGNLALATQVAAAELAAETGTMRTVTVHQLPHLVVTADNAACASTSLSANAVGEWVCRAQPHTIPWGWPARYAHPKRQRAF